MGEEIITGAVVTKLRVLCTSRDYCTLRFDSHAAFALLNGFKWKATFITQAGTRTQGADLAKYSQFGAVLMQLSGFCMAHMK